MDRGAWWAAVYGVAQSRTRLSDLAAAAACICITITAVHLKHCISVLTVKVLIIQLCPTLCDPWTVAHQAPLSMGFSRQEYWSG